MMKKVMFSIAAVAVLSGAAMADPTIVTKRQTTVGYSDLNLNSEAGVAVLYERLRVASKSVCGAVPSGADSAYDVKSYDACTSNALARALDDMGGKIPADFRK